MRQVLGGNVQQPSDNNGQGSLMEKEIPYTKARFDEANDDCSGMATPRLGQPHLHNNHHFTSGMDLVLMAPRSVGGHPGFSQLLVGYRFELFISARH